MAAIDIPAHSIHFTGGSEPTQMRHPAWTTEDNAAE